jgi:hypothetical protein
MTLQGVRLTRDHDHPVRILGIGDPERVAISVHHQHPDPGLAGRAQLRDPGNHR